MARDYPLRSSLAAPCTRSCLWSEELVLGCPSGLRSSRTATLGSHKTGPAGSVSGSRAAEVVPGGWGGDSASGRTGQQPGPHEERLGNLLDRLGFFSNRHSQRGEANRPAREAVEQRLKHGSVEPVEPALVDLVQREPRLGGLRGHDAVPSNLGKVPNATQQPVCDAGSTARSTGDLDSAMGGEVYVKQPSRPSQDELDLSRLVEVQVSGEPEAIPQGSRQQTCPSGGADQCEVRDVQWYCHRPRTLADHDIDPEVLHRHVEHLFGRPRHPVNLVEEQNLALYK